MTKFYGMLGAGLVGLTLLAQDPAETTKGQPATPLDHAAPRRGISSFNKVSTVLGMAVKDQSGKDVGRVSDLVLDLENGRMGYAVLSIPPARMVPVPIGALKPSESKDHLILNMSSTVLAAAPSVANDVWPAADAFAVGAPASVEKGQGSSSSSEAKHSN